MINILRREFSINLLFEKRKVKLTFQEPTIYDLLTFHDLLKKEKIISAIKVIIPDINERDFMSNPNGIISAVSSLIYGESKKSKIHDSTDESFMPATLDLMANRYGVLPQVLIKETTFSQLITFMKGYEWNMNLKNGNEKNNVRILMDFSDENKEENDKLLEKLKKDKEKLEKMRKIKPE